MQFGVDIIGNDDMILAIYPQVSTVIGYLNAGGASYPQLGTNEEHTTVRVHMKETLVIGGLISETHLKNLSELPFLGKIPVLGELFRNRNNTDTMRDLVVTITPELVRQGDLGGMILPDDAPADQAMPRGKQPAAGSQKKRK